MYPYTVVFGMNLYDIFLALGVISALVIARVFADKDKVGAKLFNFILLTGGIAIGFGYFGAVFTQAIYNWLDGEDFVINSSTGATFLGGLVGGVVTFRNAKNIINVIESISIHKILLETDAPYLTPEPYRGMKNDSSYIPLIVNKIASIKDITVDEVVDITTRNANDLFDF